jgi:hypothetical protein
VVDPHPILKGEHLKSLGVAPLSKGSCGMIRHWAALVSPDHVEPAQSLLLLSWIFI